MVQVEWHKQWSPAIEQAFSAMPYDELMDIEVVKRLYHYGEGRGRQRIAVFRSDDGRQVGVVPLRWRLGGNGLYSWQLLTYYVMPYARFYVLPQYNDIALLALNRYIACDNVMFYELPAELKMLRPETSWVVQLSSSYGELLKRAGYTKTERRVRKHSARLDLFENKYDDLPIALEHWAAKWRSRGSNYTMARKDELLLVFELLAAQGRLNTFSLYEGPHFVAMQISMVGVNTTYAMLTIALDEYRQAYPGIRCLLATFERACSRGHQECDLLRTASEVKKTWAQPLTRAYRLLRGPFGSPALGGVLDAGGHLLNRVYWKLGMRK